MQLCTRQGLSARGLRHTETERQDVCVCVCVCLCLYDTGALPPGSDPIAVSAIRSSLLAAASGAPRHTPLALSQATHTQPTQTLPTLTTTNKPTRPRLMLPPVPGTTQASDTQAGVIAPGPSQTEQQGGQKGTLAGANTSGGDAERQVALGISAQMDRTEQQGGLLGISAQMGGASGDRALAEPLASNAVGTVATSEIIRQCNASSAHHLQVYLGITPTYEDKLQRNQDIVGVAHRPTVQGARWPLSLPPVPQASAPQHTQPASTQHTALHKTTQGAASPHSEGSPGVGTGPVGPHTQPQSQPQPHSQLQQQQGPEAMDISDDEDINFDFITTTATTTQPQHTPTHTGPMSVTPMSASQPPTSTAQVPVASPAARLGTGSGSKAASLLLAASAGVPVQGMQAAASPAARAHSPLPPRPAAPAPVAAAVPQSVQAASTSPAAQGAGHAMFQLGGGKAKQHGQVRT